MVHTVLLREEYIFILVFLMSSQHLLTYLLATTSRLSKTKQLRIVLGKFLRPHYLQILRLLASSRICFVLPEIIIIFLIITLIFKYGRGHMKPSNQVRPWGIVCFFPIFLSKEHTREFVYRGPHLQGQNMINALWHVSCRKLETGPNLCIPSVWYKE